MIFVVGPSRGGKTTLLSAALPEFPRLKLLDLDAEEIQRVPIIQAGGGDPGGWQGRWSRNLECLQCAGASSFSSDMIVDVGAGSLQTPEGRQFFVERGRSAIAVVAPWEIVHQRHPGRDPDEFRRTEYSDERQMVYQAARFQIDSSVDFAESIQQFRVAIHSLLRNREIKRRKPTAEKRRRSTANR